MEENNKKGFNVLYAVLGVSTLVVAIIGATFAYFSASQTNTDINGTIAEAGGLVLEVSPLTFDADHSKTGSDLIPLNLILNNTPGVDTADQFEKAMAKKCRDDLGNNICEVYKIKVTNQSEEATIQIRGTLKLEVGAGENAQVPTNMYWRLINATETTATQTIPAVEEGGQATTRTYAILDEGTRMNGAPDVKQGTEGSLTIAISSETNTETQETTYEYEPTNVSLAGGASETFYVVVWLEEMGTAQEADDATGDYTDDDVDNPIVRSYKGTIRFDAVDKLGNPSGVTATFLS